MNKTKTTAATFKPSQKERKSDEWMGNFVKLGLVCDFDLDTLTNKTNDDYKFTYISLSDIDKGILTQSNKHKFKNAPSRARRVVKKGDVLLATVRPNLQSFYLLKEKVKDTIVSTGFCVLTPKNNLLSGYLFQYLFSQQMLKVFYQFNVGTNYPAINSSDIKNFPISLPPLPEQKAIADLLATWDTAIEKTEALIAAKEKQFAWLVRKIYKQIKNSNISKTSLCKYLQSISHIHGNKDAIVAAVGKKGIRDRSEIYSKELSKDYSKNKLVYRNEIVFGLANDSIVYGINLSSKLYSVSPAYKTFKIVNCNSTFLKYLLNVNNIQLSLKYLITSARQGKSVDFEGLLKEKFSFPDISKQKRITETLNTARREIDLLKQFAEHYRTQKRGIMQKLLTGKWRIKNV